MNTKGVLHIVFKWMACSSVGLDINKYSLNAQKWIFFIVMFSKLIAFLKVQKTNPMILIQNVFSETKPAVIGDLSVFLGY